MSTFNHPAATTAKHSRLVLAEFLDRFDVVVAEPDGWVVPCPAHADGHPSLRVSVNEKNNLMLFCRAGCATPAVVAELGLDIPDLFNVEVGAITVKTAAAAPLTAAHRAPLAMYLDAAVRATDVLPAGREARAYAERRFGITASLFASLGLAVDDGTVAHTGLRLSAAAYRDTARLVVPFHDFDGNPHGLQARALGESPVRWSGPVNPKDGATWGKYGVFRSDAGLPSTEVIVTEGPGDGLTSVANGYDAVCIRGASLGANSGIADEIAGHLKGQRVVVVGDADDAGMKFIATICDALSARGVDTYRLRLPSGFGDLTEWREGDPASFRTRFADAVKSAERYGEEEVMAERLTVDATHLLTDVNNARMLREYILAQGADVRFTVAAGFMVYEGHASGVWKADPKDLVIRKYAQDSTGFIQRRVLERVRSIEDRALTISSPSTREAVGRSLAKLRSKVANGSLISWAMASNGITAMVSELRSLPGVLMDFTEFDQQPDVLAVANGVLNLETGTLTAYSDVTRDLYLTRKVHVDYVPGARNPRWERFIGEVFGQDAGLGDYVQTLLGYGITGHTTEQVIAVMLGGGANGKSVLMETANSIFREYTSVAQFSTFERKDSANSGPSPDIAAIAGARLVVASEGEAGRPMAEATLKRMSGSEAVTARWLHRDPFTFTPVCLITLVSNHAPEVRGQDEGIWRRLKLIPFSRYFRPEERDKFLTHKFIGTSRIPSAAWREGDDMGDGPAGILAWFVEGARRWYEHGLVEPDVVSRASNEYRETSDRLADFITEKLVKDENAAIKCSDAHKLYLEWAEDERLSAKDTWGRNTFYAAMEERKAHKYQRSGSPWFRGYRARTARDEIDVDLGDGEASVFSTMRPTNEEPMQFDG